MTYSSGFRPREAPMSRLSSAIRRVCSAAALCLVFLRSDPASAQTVTMGLSLANGGNVNPPGVETILAMNGARSDGRITTASFGWSATPCPAAVKIKFFRPSVLLPFDARPPFAFVTERGPFDVTAPLADICCRSLPQIIQTVTLSPPVEVHAGDLVAVTNLTTCGGPVYALWNLLAPPPLGSSFTVPGDVTSTVTDGIFTQYINLTASGTGPALGLLSDIFLVTLTARDPRTGTTADGVPNLLGVGGRAGYFSLPAFTGDSTFPEVMVKMVDASREPSLGGTFWFFHAPLTDVQYTLTVKDQRTGAIKTYSNTSASPGQLCGAADTSAFHP